MLAALVTAEYDGWVLEGIGGTSGTSGPTADGNREAELVVVLGCAVLSRANLDTVPLSMCPRIVNLPSLNEAID